MTALRNVSLRSLAVGAAVGLTVSLVPAAPALAGQRVPTPFFGMHDGDPSSWPASPVGAMRLWDSGVSWREIETSPGVYDFGRLDAQIDAARARNAKVLVVLGQTPRFHSTKPGQVASYGRGAAAMPSKGAWKRYVSRVVARYRDRAGIDYQVWNEANVRGYWSGSPKQMAVLTKIASKVINRNDASAKVVAPALATRLSGQRRWLRDFYVQRTGGKRVATYVNVVSLNLYPLPSGSPEASMQLLASSRTMLRALGVRKPIWNTEINYGLLGGGTARNISRAKEAANVGRTFVLNAANDVKRVYWYSWDLGPLANTQLTNSDGASLTRAGRAYEVVRSWLWRARSKGCRTDSRGTYTCTFTGGGEVRRVSWNPRRRTTLRAVRSARWSVDLRGNEKRVSGGTAFRVGKSPIMIRSRR